MIEHRSASGRSKFATSRQDRDRNYPYHTLVAVNGPPSNCPKRRRLTREAEAATAIADGWYPDPWMAQSGKAERYYANNRWTEYTR
jgi:hypothetical protein